MEKLEGKTMHLATAFENDCMDTMAFYCLRGLVLVSEGSGRRHWHWHGTEWHGMAMPQIVYRKLRGGGVFK